MKFTLDYSKWRCGKNGPNKVGFGYTSLLNDDSYMCCLGQFSRQIDPNADIRGAYMPYPSCFSQELKDNLFTNGMDISDLSVDLAQINDNKDTTPQEKITSIRARLREEGHELEVINQS